MPKINSFSDLGKIKDQEKFFDQASSVIKELADVSNGKLEFDKNMNTQTVEVKFTAANADTAVPHNLKKTDVHYLKAKSSADCSIYDGAKENTTTVLYLRSTQIATVKLILY